MKQGTEEVGGERTKGREWEWRSEGTTAGKRENVTLIRTATTHALPVDTRY